MNQQIIYQEQKSNTERGSSAAPIPRLSNFGVLALCETLQQSGFISVFELSGVDHTGNLYQSTPALEILRRLFIQHETLTRDEAGLPLPPQLLDNLIQAGLLMDEGGRVRSLFQIQVYHEMIFLSDFLEKEGPSDLVLPIGPSSKYLASFTVRRQASTALDLGSGCGVQALLAAQHTGLVTATDINPRALAMTSLNAELNSINNIEFLDGSYFDHVSNRTFDLITCNLPYVITPENRFQYRDSGEPGDISTWRTVCELPRHLNEDGYAHIMVNWAHSKSQSWLQAFQSKIDNLKADAWLMYNRTMEPREYAGLWMDFNPKSDSPTHPAKIDEWLEWYQALGIEQISLGILTLRCRTDSTNWHCATQVVDVPLSPVGEQILCMFENQDYLSQLKEIRVILDEVYHKWNIRVTADNHNGFAVVCTDSGFRLQTRIRSTSAHILDHLDGATELGTAIEKAGKQNGFDPNLAKDDIISDFQMLLNFGMIRPVFRT